MAYMPAEEDDDYDSDGFFDMDDLELKGPKLIASTRNIHADVSESVSSPRSRSNYSGMGDREGFGTNIAPQARSAAGFTGKNNQTAVRFSRDRSAIPHSANILTLDDLKLAVLKGNTELVETCLNQGLMVDEPMRSGWTALMYAANSANSDVVQLLLKKGANPNHHRDMYTPLMAACSASLQDEEKVRDCVTTLLEAGANVNAKDRFHTTPLMLASREGHLLTVRELIKHGAEVNRQDSRGWTALTFATQRALKAVVMELLDHGADPNIQHSDKLTVKDLAAHLPTDEMLALLERRPPNLAGGSGDSNFIPRNTQSSLQGTGDVLAKCTDLKYGELEVFLLGLDLPHLVSLFQQQLIDLSLLMTLTEQDLINAGVEQVGARKKILDAVQAVHKKDWQPSSLVSIHFNSKISCADAVAMLANSSKHLRYIGSTVVYVREQLRKHPESITLPTDTVTPSQFLRHTEDTMKNVITLKEQLASLKSELVKEMKKRNLDPPDHVDSRNLKARRKYRLLQYLAIATTLASCTAVVYYKKDTVISFIPTKILSYFSSSS